MQIALPSVLQSFTRLSCCVQGLAVCSLPSAKHPQSFLSSLFSHDSASTSSHSLQISPGTLQEITFSLMNFLPPFMAFTQSFLKETFPCQNQTKKLSFTVGKDSLESEYKRFLHLLTTVPLGAAISVPLIG